MKLVKKLFIITLLASLLASTTISGSKKTNDKTIVLSDDSPKPSDYNKDEKTPITPHSINIVKTV
jgi:hypothetical protein